jgi:hypothetical protein
LPEEVVVSPTSTTPAGALVGQLRSEFDGSVITPEDQAYEDARVLFYRGYTQHPAAIVRPRDAAGVARVIQRVAGTGAELAVRSGGHSVAGHSLTEGGIVLDLSSLDTIDIDPEARTAWVGTGATAAEFTSEAGKHGLATGLGDAGSVGIGGITLGGGVGYLSRKHGLTIDSLLAADIVTADGELLTADAEHHPDLFWAIRGGGGNFGVVTRFRFALHEVDTVLGGMLILPASADVVAGFVAEADAAPDELSTIAMVTVAPPMPFLPPEVHGQLVLMILPVYAGDVDEGERVVGRIRDLAPPLVDMVQPMPYPAIYEGPEPPHPTGVASRNLFTDRVDPSRAEAVIERLRAATASMAVVQLRVLGGAVSRVPSDATAYAHRDHRIMVNVAAMYEDPSESVTHGAWVAGTAAVLGASADGDRNGDGAAYIGFLADDTESQVRAAYPGRTWDRLAEVKRRYDPENVFHRNHNIPPARM